MTLVGVSPELLRSLLRATIAASAELSTIHCDDPAADIALGRVIGARFSLDTTWIPRMATAAGDQSMLGWVADAPATAATFAAYESTATTPEEAEATAEEIVTLLADIAAGGDADDSVALHELLHRHHDDPVVMAAVFTRLGLDGWFAAMEDLLGSGRLEASSESAVLFVDALVFAPPAAGFTSSAMGSMAAARALLPDGDLPHLSAPTGSVIELVFERGRMDSEFAYALATNLIAGERALYDEVGTTGAPYPYNQWPAYAAEDDGVDFEVDPLAGALTVLAGDPARSRQLYGDRATLEFLFARNFDVDGYTGLMTSWQGACTNVGADGSVEFDPAALTEEQLEIASIGVEAMAEWDEDTLKSRISHFSPAASTAAGAVASAHLISVENAAVIAGQTPLGELTAVVAHPSAGGDAVATALFSFDGAETLLALSCADDDGRVVLRTGLHQFYTASASGAVAAVAPGELAVGEFDPVLDAAANNAALEGLYVRSSALAHSVTEQPPLLAVVTERGTAELVELGAERLRLPGAGALGDLAGERFRVWLWGADTEPNELTLAERQAGVAHLNTVYQVELLNAGVADFSELDVDADSPGTLTIDEYVVADRAAYTTIWTASTVSFAELGRVTVAAVDATAGRPAPLPLADSADADPPA